MVTIKDVHIVSEDEAHITLIIGGVEKSYTVRISGPADLRVIEQPRELFIDLVDNREAAPRIAEAVQEAFETQRASA